MEWINVVDRKPDIGQEVLCIDQFKNYEAAIYTSGYFKTQTPFLAVTSGEFRPTHWMPLPEPPSE